MARQGSKKIKTNNRTMRTIKFRGKRIDNGGWVYGDLLTNTRLALQILTFYGQYLVDTDTIGQLTGLYDKNGKEIYEGDILRKQAKEQFEIKNFVGYEVFWHDNDCADNHIGWQMNRHHYNGCICGTTDFVKCLPKYCRQMEIIGNIYDNPELIKY